MSAGLCKIVLNKENKKNNNNKGDRFVKKFLAHYKILCWGISGEFVQIIFKLKRY